MDVLNDMLNLVKCKVQFTTPEGDYEGIVKLVCPVTRKLIVEKVFFLPKHLFMGELNFHMHEILSYKLISQPQLDLKKKPGGQLHSFNVTRAADTPILDNCSKDGDEIQICYNDMPKEKEYTIRLPPQLSSVLPIDHVVLNFIDREFHQAIVHIGKQDTIGVCLEGPNISRNGIFTWLSMASSFCTFLFDIQSLKERAFEKGLKAILEDPKIEKVFHDCRKASDCLHHMFNTKIVNVFDTQVADLFVTMQRNKKGTIMQNVSALNFSLSKYLDLSYEFLPHPRQRSYRDEVLNYHLRPLRNELQDLFLKKVIYLRVLKQKLTMLMLDPFHRAIEVYLQVVQSATDRELLLEPSFVDEIPPQLAMDGLQIVRFRDHVSVSLSGPPYRKDFNSLEYYNNSCKDNKNNPDESNIFPPNTVTSSKVNCSHPSKNNISVGPQHFECTSAEKKLSDNSGTESVEIRFQDVTSKGRVNNFIFLKKVSEMKKEKKKNVNPCEIKSEIIQNTTVKAYNTEFSDIESNTFPKNDCLDFTNGVSQVSSNTHEDPWAKLREAFADVYNTEEKKNVKNKFIPAGMA